MRPSTNDFFAGKVVLITRDERPQSLQQTQLLAKVADHYLIEPPDKAMVDGGVLIDWVKSIDFTGVSGVIVSLDALSGDSAESDRSEILKWVRARRPSISIYGFTSGSSDKQIQSSLKLAEDSVIDFLLISGEGAKRPNLQDEITRRKVGGKVSIEPGAETAAMALFSRMLCRRFGFTPKIYPGFSSVEDNTAPLRQEVSEAIRVVGGVQPSQQEARASNALLFVYMPQTTAANRDGLFEAIARTVETGAPVALVDLSETKESKEELMAGLRRLKLLDKMIAYASSSPASPGRDSMDTIIRAVSQISAFLNAIKFLRDDIDRIIRFDRAQFELLFSRYLTDWAYELTVRPDLDKFVKTELKADPEHLESATEKAEAFTFERIKQIADEIFKEQFRHNVHSIMLSGGERSQFQISMLQRLQVRLHTKKTSEVEIRQSVYVPQVSSAEAGQAPGRAKWFLEGDDVDGRIVRRFVSTDWGRFKSDATEVDFVFKLSSQNKQGAQASQESYAISSSKKGEVRRITVTSPSGHGAFYALSKLESLGADGRLAEDFQISESPAVARRGIAETLSVTSWSHSDRLETLRFLGLARMNRYLYAPKGEEWREEYSEQDLQRFRQLLRASDENFVRFIYAIRPGNSFAYSSEEDTGAIIRKLEELVSIGVQSFALCFEDTQATLQNNKDREQFKTLASSQASLINLAHKRLKELNPDFELYVSPNIIKDQRAGEDYLKDIRTAIPQDILLLIAGSSSNQATPDSRSIVWDNFAANEDPRRLLMNAKRIESGKISEGAGGFIATASVNARASMLPLATAGEYAWDPRKYDPQQSFERAMNLLYDERARQGLRVWAKLYEDGVYKPLFQQQTGAIDAEALKRKLAELQAASELIGVTLNQALLRGELVRLILIAQSVIEK